MNYDELNELSKEYVTLWLMIVIMDARRINGSRLDYSEGYASKAFDRYSTERYGTTLDDLRMLSIIPLLSAR